MYYDNTRHIVPIEDNTVQRENGKSGVYQINGKHMTYKFSKCAEIIYDKKKKLINATRYNEGNSAMESVLSFHCYFVLVI